MKHLYLCSHCGNLAGKLIDSGVDMVCCGEKMTELVPKTADQAVEKHVPVIKVDGGTVEVTVGSTPHPMTDEHHIAFIILETDQGFQRKALKIGGEPSAKFHIGDDEKVVAAYEYCNVHGFWMAEA
jgi:superoxide reductase